MTENFSAENAVPLQPVATVNEPAAVHDLESQKTASLKTSADSAMESTVSMDSVTGQELAATETIPPISINAIDENANTESTSNSRCTTAERDRLQAKPCVFLTATEISHSNPSEMSITSTLSDDALLREGSPGTQPRHEKEHRTGVGGEQEEDEQQLFFSTSSSTTTLTPERDAEREKQQAQQPGEGGAKEEGRGDYLGEREGSSLQYNKRRQSAKSPEEQARRHSKKYNAHEIHASHVREQNAEKDRDREKKEHHDGEQTQHSELEDVEGGERHGHRSRKESNKHKRRSKRLSVNLESGGTTSDNETTTIDSLTSSVEIRRNDAEDESTETSTQSQQQHVLNVPVQPKEIIPISQRIPRITPPPRTVTHGGSANRHTVWKSLLLFLFLLFRFMYYFLSFVLRFFRRFFHCTFVLFFVLHVFAIFLFPGCYFLLRSLVLTS
jgi:hypothetical protein